MRLLVTSYCTDPDCRCDDRRGVIEYDGPSAAAAARAKRDARYPVVRVERVRWVRYSSIDGRVVSVHPTEAEAVRAMNIAGRLGFYVRPRRFGGVPAAKEINGIYHAEIDN